MGTHQETSTLKTLADAVTETVAAEKAKDGLVGTEGLDVNAAFDGGGAVVAKETVVRTETGEVGPGGPDADLGKTKENGASLSFEGEGAKKCGDTIGGESGIEQRSSLDKKDLAGANGALPSETQMGDNHKERERKMKDLCDDGRACAMETDEGNGDSFEVEHMEDHKYSVGDLVWGKIKSHPWWPGQIYDPSDASESAMKYSQKDRLLVAYFGDGSFAWCLPSQLIPFAPHFEGMSKQSTSKAFVNAVQEAVDEIGRLVELEMTCPCIPEEIKNGLTRPQAMNAGVKDGVLVPNGEIGKLLSFRYEPVELLAAVANAAESVSFPSMLDFSILKGWLSAYYRERGGYVLPVHGASLPIEGLEDKNRNESNDANDFSVPIEVPIHRPHEEDSFSPAASGPGNGLPPQEDKNHHRRKQKSVAEIMAEGTGAKLNVRKRIVSGEGTNASKKQKLIVEIENDSGSSLAAQGLKRGRKKKDDISQSGESGEEMQESKLGKDRITYPDTNDGEGVKEAPEEISSPRERKKSKYLCPPYTTPHDKVGNLSFKKEEFEKEPTERKTNRAKMGERMTMAAGKVLESSPGMKKCNGNTVEKKLLKEKTEAGGNSSHPSGKRKAVGAIDVNGSVDQLLSRIQSFAVNPVGSGNGGGSVDSVSGFFSAFRKYRYAEEGESCKDVDGNSSKKKRPGARKSFNTEPEKLVVGELPVTGGGIGEKNMQEKLDDDGPPKGKGDRKSSTSVKEKSSGKKKEADVRSSPASGKKVIGASSHSAAVGEITDIGSARETLKVMASMLQKWDDKKISTDVISELNADLKLVFEKMKKTAELVGK